MADDKIFEMTERPAVREYPADSDDKASSERQEATSDRPGSRNPFERYINRISLVNFGFTLQAGWETVGLTFQFALLNGGPATLFYGSILAGLGSTAIATSLGEMASMDPAVGAQYRWSAAFAPSLPEFWGLLQGWITVFAWMTNVGGSLVVLASMVQGLIIFNDATYVPQGWHAALLMWAFIAVPVACNLWLRRTFNTLETIGGVCHVVFFFACTITLVVLARRSTADFVFTTLIHDVSGWTNPAAAWSIGLLTVTFPITSFDGVLHMSDEVKKPETRVPFSMILATFLNSMLQTAYIICLLFTIGDLDTVANSPTRLPIIEVFYAATKSHAATNVFVCMHGAIFSISLFNIFASVSRLTWSFAKDKGLPFSNFFSYVHPRLQIPLNALFLVGFIDALLALINIGSSAAFNALVSLPTVALYISYSIPIFLLLVRKVRGLHPRYGPFKLGRWGIPINVFALTYLIYLIIWMPFPSMRPVTASNMNYAGPIMLGVIIFALGDWFLSGHKRFVVPVSRYRLGL